MQKEQYNYKIKQVEQTIDLNTQQLKLSVDYIVQDGNTSSLAIKDQLNHELYKIQEDLSILKQKSLKKQEEYFINKSKALKCDVSLLNKKFKPIFNTNIKNNGGFKQYILSQKKIDTWQVFVKKDEKTFCPSITKHIVQKRIIDNNTSLLISCNVKDIYTSVYLVEAKIKEYLQKSFSFTNNLHHGNTFLMWLNVKNETLNKTLYHKNDKQNNEKYCISKLSNVTHIKTGLLSAKEILEASDKAPIRHLMNKKEDENNYIYEAITWVKSINEHDSRRLIFITTIFEDDLNNDIDSVFFKVLPASIMAFIFSILLAFLFFRKFFRSLDILLDTSKKVQKGNLNYRSNIKGKDQIGILGHTFDSMLDSMQNNIKHLDATVKERTLELEQSLDEKNTLLKEIHHRVKNNLAFTINLIKLQSRKVSDQKTKDLLSQLQDRIYIMELLHKKLYESQDLNSIDFKKYINDLVHDLTYAYDLKDVKLNINIEEVNLDIEYAMPCGLIINECITNAYKYAFTKDNNEFSILFKKEENKCTLEISDNGLGFPKNLDINKTKSLGLRLITSIAKGQLLGNIEYKKDKGVKFIIVFYIEE